MWPVTNTPRMTRRVRVLLLVALGLVSAACSKGAGSAPVATKSSSASPDVVSPLASPLKTGPPPSLPPQDEPVVQVVRRVQPAVVNVVTNLFQQTAFGEQRERGVGTGFVV